MSGIREAVEILVLIFAFIGVIGTIRAATSRTVRNAIQEVWNIREPSPCGGPPGEGFLFKRIDCLQCGEIDILLNHPLPRFHIWIRSHRCEDVWAWGS